MTFFNPKEDVIDIKLTQYGKFLLSMGELKPEYYAFFDDDILYDAGYASETENQNAAKGRILTKTPRLKAQYVFRGIETEIKKSNRLTRYGEEVIDDVLYKSDLLKGTRIQQTADKNYSLSAPIGTSDMVSDYAPSWKIGFLKGELDSADTSLTGSYQTVRIPQIETLPEYLISVIQDEVLPQEETSLEDVDSIVVGDPNVPGSNVDAALAAEQLPDGTVISVEEDYILLEIGEHNSEFNIKNFDIEVFEIQSEVDTKIPLGTKEVLVPLYFQKQPEMIVNGILLDKEEIENQTKNQEINPTYVDLFFDVLVDKEIPEEIFCSVKPIGEKTDEIYFGVDFDCPEGPEQVGTKDMYKSTFKEDDFEDC